MSLIERLAHMATVLATVIALIAFAVTSVADNRRAASEERKSIQDEVLINILSEKIQWDQRELAAEFSRRLANLDRDVLERSDGAQPTFEATLARMIVAQVASMMDQDTVALANHAASARSSEFVNIYMQEVQSQLFGFNNERIAVFHSSAGTFTFPEILSRASHLLPDLEEGEIERLVRSEMNAGFIVEVGTVPDSGEKLYGWVGVQPM